MPVHSSLIHRDHSDSYPQVCFQHQHLYTTMKDCWEIVLWYRHCQRQLDIKIFHLCLAFVSTFILSCIHFIAYELNSGYFYISCLLFGGTRIWYRVKHRVWIDSDVSQHKTSLKQRFVHFLPARFLTSLLSLFSLALRVKLTTPLFFCMERLWCKWESW